MNPQQVSINHFFTRAMDKITPFRIHNFTKHSLNIFFPIFNDLDIMQI